MYLCVLYFITEDSRLEMTIFSPHDLQFFTHDADVLEYCQSTSLSQSHDFEIKRIKPAFLST